ncbi:hypothetical protein I3W98_35415, partial [Streptomyces cavourensis]|nr:hypothetical protein [Streptomyces cavourensis]
MRPKPRLRLRPRPPAPSGVRRLARRHPGALLALFLCSTGGALAALALPAALGTETKLESTASRSLCLSR